KSMEAQRTRARAASKFGTVDPGTYKLEETTEFVGYEALQGECTVSAIFRGEVRVESADAGDSILVVLDRTPFYAESGGQAGDTGKLYANGISFDVLDTVKGGNAFLHNGKLLEGSLSVGDQVNAEVDRKVRDATRLNHSATHLLHAALKIVLGEHVNQRGSLVDADRLRFDFSHFEPVTKSELRTIERLVNEQVRLNSPIQTEIMALEDARAKGAMALFGEKYSADVRVLTMGDGFSIELCGGTHASRTGDIGLMRITNETGTASGVRRIEALTGGKAVEQIESVDDMLDESMGLVRADRTNLIEKVAALVAQNKKLEKDVSSLNMKLASGGGKDLADEAITIEGVKAVIHLLEGGDPKALPDAMDRVKNKLQSGVVILAAVSEGKVALIAGVTKDLTDRINAGKLVNHVAVQIGGKGGGRPDMARAGGTDVDALPAALDSVAGYLKDLLT
ncbi:MAG: alanyl-tRNA synthetase, partial [Litorivivens sp.]